jgi:hypothetical protein
MQIGNLTAFPHHMSVSRANLGNMRKVPALALVLALSITGLAPASAATKAQNVTAAFKTLLNTTGDSLDALEQKYESDIDALDSALANSTIAANSTYDQEIQAASNLHAPQISASTLKMSEARAKFASVSGVKVVTLGTNRNYWGNLNCPTTRPDCIDVDKGEKFNVGEVTTLKAIIGTKTDYLLEIDIMLGLGLIELTNRTEYLTVTSTLKTEPTNLSKITTEYTAAQTAAKNKRDRAIQAATALRESALADLDEDYEIAKAELEAKETAASLALLAAKRASKDPNFDAAFVIAYKFEYNRQMVGEIADAAWTGDWTYRTIDSIIKVNKLAITGDAIGSKYSKSAASAFNSAVGNAFTNEPDFRAALKVLTAIYKQTTKTTLKF